MGERALCLVRAGDSELVELPATAFAHGLIWPWAALMAGEPNPGGERSRGQRSDVVETQYPERSKGNPFERRFSTSS
jgi:hypothetical protein